MNTRRTVIFFSAPHGVSVRRSNHVVHVRSMPTKLFLLLIPASGPTLVVVRLLREALYRVLLPTTGKGPAARVPAFPSHGLQVQTALNIRNNIECSKEET